jgi:hypothetical protein
LENCRENLLAVPQRTNRYTENHEKKQRKVVQSNNFFKGAYSTIISVTWRDRDVYTTTIEDCRWNY